MLLNKGHLHHYVHVKEADRCKKPIPTNAHGIMYRKTIQVNNYLPRLGDVMVITKAFSINDTLTPLPSLRAIVGGQKWFENILGKTIPISFIAFSGVKFEKPDLIVHLDVYIMNKNVREDIVEAPIVYCDEHSYKYTNGELEVEQRWLAENYVSDCGL